MQGTPQAIYSRDPPLELKDQPHVQEGDDVGYVTFGTA